MKSKLAHIITLLALLILVTRTASADTGGITVISDFYDKCGIAVALYDENDNLLAIDKYVSTKDYQKIIFLYLPQHWGFPIDRQITIRTQFPAMRRTGCRLPFLVKTYPINWVANTQLCFQVNEQSMAPCSPNLAFDAEPTLIGLYPPRRRNLWHP